MNMSDNGGLSPYTKKEEHDNMGIFTRCKLKGSGNHPKDFKKWKISNQVNNQTNFGQFTFINEDNEKVILGLKDGNKEIWFREIAPQYDHQFLLKEISLRISRSLFRIIYALVF